MKKIIYFIIATLIFSQFVNAQGWVSYFKSNAPSYYNASVIDLFEMDDGNFMSSGLYPGIVILNAETGDTVLTSNHAGGNAVRTTDGGYMFGIKKLNNNLELEWQIPASIISTLGLIDVHEIIRGNDDNILFSGRTYLQFGDAPFPFEYNCIWSLNSSTGTYQSSVNILALTTLTLDDWAAGENNDMVPLIDGPGWMVFAQCNDCHSCFIKRPNIGISQTCLGYSPETHTIIHANEGDGYIVTMGIRTIAKVNLNGNLVWSELYNTTIPPIVPGTYGFHNIISTGTDGYIAVGRTKNNNKLWVIKIDNNGNEQWQSDQIKIKNYNTVGRTIMKTSDGGYLIGGVAVRTSIPIYEAYPFFVKMDSTGNCRPQAAFTHSLNNFTLNIESNTSAGAHEYTWLFGNADTAHTATPVYTYPYPGTYNLCLVASSPCGNDTLCTQIDVATGINAPKPTAPVLSLYPNPVSANQNIYWQAVNISQGAAVQLRVFNLPGNTIYQETINQHSGTLPSQTWPPGLYFLQLITPSGETTIRLVVTGE